MLVGEDRSVGGEECRCGCRRGWGRGQGAAMMVIQRVVRTSSIDPVSLRFGRPVHRVKQFGGITSQPLETNRKSQRKIGRSWQWRTKRGLLRGWEELDMC